MNLSLNDAYGEYLRSLRAVARGLWKGILSWDQAYDAMYIAVRNGITRGWYEGLKEAGIQPSEMSPAEDLALKQMVFSEINRIGNFLDWCTTHSEANGWKWASCDARAKMWALRARDARNSALTMARTDPKLIWRLGHTEKHCGTCSKLNGKVKRASYWTKLDLRPQNPPNPLLECGGYNCGCRLDPTDEPLSKGTLGNLP